MEKSKVKSSLDTFYVDVDYFKKIDVPYEFIYDDSPGEWKMRCERDEDGNPIEKDGVVKLHVRKVHRRIYGKRRHPKYSKGYISARVMFVNPNSERYRKATVHFPRKKVKVLPHCIDEKNILIKDKYGDLIIDEEIW